MSKLRLMSQNQWNVTENLPFWKERGEDCSAEVRMKGHVRILKELLPDIVGGQEVNAEMQKYLKFYCMDEHLPYTQIWGGFTPLIYRADKLELLDAVCNYYRNRFGVTVTPDQVASCNGSQEGIGHIGMVLCDEGDTVLLPTPCYPVFIAGVKMAGAEAWYYPMTK